MDIVYSMLERHAVTIIILIYLAMTVCFSLRVAGAISYNDGHLFAAVIAYCLHLLLCCGKWAENDMVTVIRNDALCIYLHASLIMKIQNGIMSPATHEREE
jgi:hypothetical protein